MNGKPGDSPTARERELAQVALTEAMDRIAKLEAELAEARRIADETSSLGAEKDRSYYRVCQERQKALADLDAERAAHARTQAERDEARTARDLNRQEFEDAHAACLRTQAESAELRQKLQHLKPVVVDFYRELRITEEQIETSCDYVSMGRRVEYLEDVLISLRDRVYDSLQEYCDSIAALDSKDAQ